ncbi:MAG: hypothetical protein Q4F27_04740, partial [Desulfovibrionaceae bacterium]|nr:hypothetical protein [Desulfovibrionaceae bacterium]
TGLHIDKEKIIISNKKDSSISIYDKRISLKGKESNIELDESNAVIKSKQIKLESQGDIDIKPGPAKDVKIADLKINGSTLSASGPLKLEGGVIKIG